MIAIMDNHGSYTARADQQLIYTELKGSLNKETMTEYVREVQKLTSDLSEEVFCILVNAIDFDGATPEAYRIANQHNEWLLEMNICAKAIVHGSKLKWSIAKAQSEALNNERISVFYDIESARSWLKEICCELSTTA